MVALRRSSGQRPQGGGVRPGRTAAAGSSRKRPGFDVQTAAGARQELVGGDPAARTLRGYRVTQHSVTSVSRRRDRPRSSRSRTHRGSSAAGGGDPGGRPQTSLSSVRAAHPAGATSQRAERHRPRHHEGTGAGEGGRRQGWSADSPMRARGLTSDVTRGRARARWPRAADRRARREATGRRTKRALYHAVSPDLMVCKLAAVFEPKGKPPTRTPLPQVRPSASFGCARRPGPRRPIGAATTRATPDRREPQERLWTWCLVFPPLRSRKAAPVVGHDRQAEPRSVEGRSFV